MKQALNILHVEDSREDSELMHHLLRDGGFDCKIDRIETRGELLEALEKSEYDLILSDCTLPQFHGLQALEVAHNLKPETPFIFVSGTIGEEIAIQSLHNGATDYVLKHRISRLVPAVKRALQETSERALRRTMEERLHQARRLEAIGTMAGGIVHDFNNLLQVIRMNTSLLLLELDNPAELMRIAQNLLKTSDRGASLMKELSAFARTTSTHFESVEVTPAILESAEILRTIMPRDVKLVLQMDDELPTILADPDQLDRIVTNLVVNAKDAMPEGGTITISAEAVQIDPPPVHFSKLDNLFYVCLRVIDTGAGMSEAAMKRAFEPFFTTKPVGKGTGLGLAVVFGLMQVHNGFIDLQSKQGVGTTLSLFFPVSSDAQIDSDRIRKISSGQIFGGAAGNLSPTPDLKSSVILS